MIDFGALYNALGKTPAAGWVEQLQEDITRSFDKPHGDLARWLEVVQALPQITPSVIDLQSGVQIGSKDDLSESQQGALETQLRGLHPWRKGPFDLFGIHVDTEWRSDWKWERIRDHIDDLSGRVVLDIGSGNGYYCLRMAGAGAALTIGIDPAKLFTMQFHAIKHFIPHTPAYVVPLGIEDLPPGLAAFDTVFSMGVLYHRRSPVDFLYQLRDCLRPGGQLVLETLVVEGDERQVLVPGERYAQMRNVWFIPSCAALEVWMRRCGFRDIQIVDVTTTTVEEQRTTDWMSFDSLPKFLDPEDPGLTIEGFPAPRRAVLVATAP